jgi:hypothetical protein
VLEVLQHVGTAGWLADGGGVNLHDNRTNGMKADNFSRVVGTVYCMTKACLGLCSGKLQNCLCLHCCFSEPCILIKMCHE